MNYPFQLLEILKGISAIAEQHNVLIVPGGGAFAHQIRVLHERRYISDSAAHWLAIRCMDLNGIIMSDIRPSLNLYSGIDAIDRWTKGYSFIIQPYELMKYCDSLPHSWDVTSDSIALWMGIQGDADAVLILKSINPYLKLVSAVQPETEVARPESIQFLIDKEIIDHYMAQLHPNFKGDLYILNGLKPENISRILTWSAE